MQETITVTINGTARQSTIDTRELLVTYLREHLNLTGTHIGCDTSSCGACTILVDGSAVKSCTMFAVQANGARITTVEGLAQNGEYHPLQQAFWEKHGLQCGFCTPGMMIAASQLLERNPNPTDDEIRAGLRGNLCRCTGYHNIVEAVKFAAQLQHGEGA